MKRCPKCDIQFCDDFSFCGKCATKLEPIPDPTGAKPRKSGLDLRKKDTTSEAKMDASAGNSLLESAQASYAAGQYTDCIRQLEKAKESGIIEARRMCGIFLDESEAFRKAYDDYLYSKTLKNVKKVTSPPPEQTAQSPAKTAGNAPRDKLSEDIFQAGLAAFKAEQFYSAVDSFRKAANQGHSDAQFHLGQCYYYGKGVSTKYALAAYYYSLAAEKGHIEAQSCLGKCYYLGEGVKKNYSEAVKYFRPIAEQGQAEAQYYLGNCYYHGNNGVMQDYVEAFKWYRKAAEQGHAEAQYSLGICYYLGEGVKQDYAEASEWYRKAAEQGHAKAQSMLDKSTSQKSSEKENHPEKRENHIDPNPLEVLVNKNHKAAEQDHARTQSILDKGTSQNCTENENHPEERENHIDPNPLEVLVNKYLRAAEQGNAYAQNWLGVHYKIGEGVRQDSKEAAKWFQKAAEQGHALAQFNLGQCYWTGDGVTQDDTEAEKWWRKAAEQGDSDAKRKLSELSNPGYKPDQQSDISSSRSNYGECGLKMGCIILIVLFFVILLATCH